MPDASSTKRSLGLTASAAAVVASMIGAGIYTSPGYTLGSLGTAGWTLGAWAVGGAIAICGAISYGALASRITESGGEYTYLSRTVHPLVGFLAGWVSLVAGFAGAAATAAASLAVHLPIDGPASTAFAGVVIVAAAILHGWRVREAAGVQTLVVAGKLLLIVIGLTIAGRFAFSSQLPDRSGESLATPGVFAVSLMWIAMSYSGFNAAVYFSDEVREPKRTVPRALALGTGITVILYLAIVAAVVTIPPVDSVAGRDDPVAATAEALRPGGGAIVSWLICLSQVTSISALAMAGPRVTARMAKDGLLPRWLSATNGAPPRFAIALHTLLAVALLSVATLRDLLFHVGATLSLSAAVAVASIWVLARRGERPDGRAWLVAAPVFVAGTLLTIGVAIWSDRQNAVGTVAAIGSGLAAYGMTRLLGGRPFSEECEGAKSVPEDDR